MGLGDNISSDDMNRVHNHNNPPSSTPGFEFDDDDSGLNDIFDDLGDFGGSSNSNSSSGGFGGGNSFGGGGFGGGNSFGGGNNNGFGGGNSFGGGGFGGGNSFGNNGFGGGNTFGNNGFGGSTFGGGNTFGNNGFGGSTFGGQGGFNSLNGMNNGMQNQQQKPDIMDSMIDASIDASKSLWAIIVELAKSIKLRNVDDYGYLGTCLLQTGGIMTGASIVALLIGYIGNLEIFKFSGISPNFLISGGLLCGTGLVALGTSALVLSKHDVDCGNIAQTMDIPEDNNTTTDFEDNMDSISEDLFSDDFDFSMDEMDFEFDSLDENEFSDTNNDISDEFEVDIPEEEEEFNGEGILETIQENQYITRETLFNAFKPLFTYKTPNFAEKKRIDQDDELFLQIETACLKAISNIQGCDIEDVNSSVEEAYDSLFSYEIKLKRVRKMNKTDELAKELEIYFRENSTDMGVNATVNMEGDFYKIIITKGKTAIITFGDIFKQEYCCEFFLNKNHKLPMITGITELGEVILDDAKVFDTMLIAGKPRSGKSWYVLSILMCLMLFNTPEDVQFVIVDPKESNLFKTISLMPHVCGLHNDEQVLDIMDDLIKVEGPRRKKILSDHRCDDIWALRKKGIKLPILYLVIDEYITVRNNLGDAQKDLDKKLQTIISQLPSLGIRLLFVPHRATGIVDRTNRTMLQYTACVKSDQSEVTDTLDIKKWSRPLVNPGDLAIKTSVRPDAVYARGPALTTDDNQNTDFIRLAAQVFYKMGVDLPDMSAMTIACNRDSDYIREELSGGGIREQFNATNVLDNIDL